MARPKKHRRINCNPVSYYFKPRGVPMYKLAEVVLDHDELEALRLADLLKLSHDEGAKKMKISRATFGRIISNAREKTADSILNGKAIRINDLPEKHSQPERSKFCKGCGRSWHLNQ
jgi:uncharacterized protein